MAPNKGRGGGGAKHGAKHRKSEDKGIPALSHEKYMIFSAVEQQMDDLNKIGEDLYRYKETKGHESKSHHLITRFLKRKGFSVHPDYMSIKHSFRATFGEGKPGFQEHPNVGFLCQYDADAEAGHCYGHNLVTVVALTAALGLQPILLRATHPVGQITVIGCASDSNETGKMTMLEAGGFQGIDFLMAAYPANFTNTSPRFMGCRSHKIKFRGRTIKPTDMPWDIANPVNAVVLAYQNIASIRPQFNQDWSVHSVITSGGTKADKIAETSSMNFLLKAPKPVEIKVLGEMLHRCFEAAAGTSGCKFEIEPTNKEFLCSISTKKLPEVYRSNAELMGFTFHNEKNDIMEPEDVANVSTSIPTFKIFYYCGTSARPGTDEFTRYVGSKDCQFMSSVQGKALAMTALDFMTYEDYVREIFEEHQEELVTLYECMDKEKAEEEANGETMECKQEAMQEVFSH